MIDGAFTRALIGPLETVDLRAFLVEQDVTLAKEDKILPMIPPPFPTRKRGISIAPGMTFFDAHFEENHRFMY